MGKRVLPAAVFLLATLLLLMSTAWAEPVDLTLKFTRGERIEYDISMSGSGSLRGPDGANAAMGLRGSCRVSATVAEVLPDGNAKLQLLLPQAEMSVTVAEQQARFSYMNGRVRWFANGQEQAPPDQDISQVPMLGVPLEVVASPRGQIMDVVLPELQKLAPMQQMPPGLGAPNLDNLGEPLFPDHPVEVGETWQRSVSVFPFGPTLPMTMTSSRTLDSFTNEGGLALAKISGHTQSTVRFDELGFGAEGSEVNVSMPEMTHRVTSTEFFNTNEGKLVRADYIASTTVRLQFSAGDQGQQEAGLDARVTMTVQAR